MTRTANTQTVFLLTYFILKKGIITSYFTDEAIEHKEGN